MLELLKLHWMLVERLDGTSPLICFGDDGGGGGGAAGGGGGEGGSEGSEGGTEGVDSSDFDGSGLEGGTGGFDSSDFDGTGLEGSTGGGSVEGGTVEGGTGDAGGGAAAGGGGAAAGGGGAGGGGPENDFASLDNSAPKEYADYGSAAALGSNVSQGLGAAAPDQQAAGQTAGQTVSDFLSSSQNAPSAPGAPDILELAGLAAPGREDKEDKESKDKNSTFWEYYDVPPPGMLTPGQQLNEQLEKEFNREMERELQQPSPPSAPQQDQREIPANAMPTSFNSPYGSQLSNVNTFVGPSQKEQGQWAPSSTTTGLTPDQIAQSNAQNSIWDVGPTTAVNAFGVGPTANPFASTNVWDFPNPTTQQAAPPKEEQQPWDQQQTAFNTFGFNPTTPQGYNMPAAIAGTPTGAPPPDQQVATGPNQVQTTGFIAPNPTTPVTQGPPLGPATPTGKSDFVSARDPFSNKDPWNPDYFAPPVGMLMANVPTAPQSSLQEWPTPDKPGTPFGPQAPTQASPQAVAQGPQAQQGQAPMPTGQQAFNTTPISQQVPQNLFDLPPTQQQTPPSRASVLARSGPPEQEKEQFTREQLAIMTDPRALQPYAPPPPPPVATAPPPSRTVDIPSHNQYEWPAQAPGRNFTVDASGNLSFAPSAPPTGREPGPAAITDAMPTGGVPLGDLPGGGFSPSQAGGGSGVVQLPPQRQQLSAQRRKPDRTTQAGRDAITEALMRRDLFASGVSDFDRLRLQP